MEQDGERKAHDPHGERRGGHTRPFSVGCRAYRADGDVSGGGEVRSDIIICRTYFPLPGQLLCGGLDTLKGLGTGVAAAQRAARVTARSLTDVTQHGFTLWSSIESGNSLMLLRCG